MTRLPRGAAAGEAARQSATAPADRVTVPAPLDPRPRVVAYLPPGTTLVHGPRDVDAVALTFDDGPHPAYTRQILAVLAERHVRATFFVVGKMAAAYPHLVAEEQAQGHLVADHSYNHADMEALTRTAARTEWTRCKQVIDDITGGDTHFCRPPRGRYNRATLAAAAEAGMSVVLWSRYPADIGKPGVRTIVARTLRGVRRGEIILLHDGIQQTIDALPAIIEGLRAQGFELQTVEEMAATLASPAAPAGTRPRQVHTAPARRGIG